jgi:Tripartite tricarboxylate transporter family receptor
VKQLSFARFQAVQKPFALSFHVPALPLPDSSSGSRIIFPSGVKIILNFAPEGDKTAATGSTMHTAGRRFVHVVLLGCTLCGLASLAIGADDYPSRPVTIVVPFTPGASTDTLARFEADVLQRALHQSFVVENRPGAGGEVGIAFAAKAAPDGYTLLHVPSVITLLPYLKKSISYNLADFDPVVLVGLTQFGLVVSPSLPVNSVQDLIALAKAQPGA